MLSASISSLVDLFFPPRCYLCEKLIAGQDEKVLCPECLGKIVPLGSPLCLRCGFPFPFSTGPDRLCGVCLSQKRPFRFCRQLGRYQGALLESIHRFKYQRIPALAKPLGRLLADLVEEHFPWQQYDLIVPVPLHPRRLREREFNQALLLAKGMGKALGIRVDFQSLIRVKWTEPQVKLNWQARRKNVSRAFSVKEKKRISGRLVLLVDDVMTSGATIEECSRTLLKAGAREVDAVALARAVGQENDLVGFEEAGPLD